MRFFFLLLMAVLCGFSAFGEDDYCPLHIGDEWTYVSDDIDPHEPKAEGPDHSRIRGIIEKVGKTYFVVETWGKNRAKTSESSYIRKDENGVHIIFPGGNNGAEFLWLPAHLKIGSSWKYGDNMTCTVKDFQNVTIHTQKYKNCCHIVFATYSRQYIFNVWLAPNLGLVKSVDVFSDGVKRTKVLVVFKPGK